ncbi:LRR domain containing protein [Trema orientale]|uniref:LRR domain containing protein n=1 Tax=Trema orientale TaxID=63057 RepID=A0A2P5AUS2_TREOI|nr:LRR domain containing protein [Trema orientale]
MSNGSTLELPDWFGCLSSLKILDLRGNNFDKIPKSIKKISGLTELRISNCENLRSLPELPLSIGFLDASGCKSLETVSNSKGNLAQGQWNEYHVTFHKEFLFGDCSNLDENALSICCPGNEIPSWFSDQSEKSSITVKLTPDWHQHFIGFALGAIVAFEDSSFKGDFWEFELKNRFTTLELDHVFMWYEYQDYHHDYLDAVEVYFDFLLKQIDQDGDPINSSHAKFKKCGVHLLSVEDAEGFGINSNPYPFEELDDIFDETIDPDTDEPHPKRTKLSNL